tara:strand:+ start:216 stop:2054 length:1839 start_codon:yes stop_codon:yes gene_type:complete
MTTYIIDTETNGLLKDLDTIHCMVVRDADTGDYVSYESNHWCMNVYEGVKFLMQQAEKLDTKFVGHNLIGFDIPALAKVYPTFELPEHKCFDTLVASRLIFPDRWDADSKLVIKQGFPKRLSNRHSLEAWGHRLQCHKGEYTGDTNIEDVKERKAKKWDRINEDMINYCIQDTLVTKVLYEMILGKNYSQEALDLEHEVRFIISAQERCGVAFDTDAAAELAATLTKRKLELEGELSIAFPDMYVPNKVWCPKRDNKTMGYCADARITAVTHTQFSASNRNHIVYWLKAKYNWIPKIMGDDGKPKMDEVILKELDYPEVALLREYLVVNKRLAAVANAPQAWLRHVTKGRMHGSVITNGAVTGRATHSKPNLGQVPAVYSAYGKECRALFTASSGRRLVGADQSGVEGRCLAHFMALWDDGEYCRVVLDGDIHTTNQEAAGLATRDNAKTFFYAFIYGAGNEKIGSIVGKDAKEGRRLRKKFLTGLPALKKLIDAVKDKAQQKGYLVGLDKRRIPIRNAHSALNTLLQSAGALLAKKSMVIMREKIIAKGWEQRAQQVLWNHDEHQWDCEEAIADEVGKMQVEAYQEAGKYFNFRIPIDGEYKVGMNWADTH